MFIPSYAKLKKQAKPATIAKKLLQRISSTPPLGYNTIKYSIKRPMDKWNNNEKSSTAELYINQH